MDNESSDVKAFDKRYKKFGDLTAKDWLAVGRKLKLSVDDMKKTRTKGQLIKFIYDNKQEWFNELDLTADRIYFHKFNIEKDGEKRTIMNTQFDAPHDASEYKYSPAHTRFFLSPEQLKEMCTSDFDNDEIEFEAMSDYNVSETKSTSRRSSESVTNAYKEIVTSTANHGTTPQAKIAGFRTKLKYEPDDEIERFLSCVESYCRANNLDSESNQISITITCLNQTDEGALAVNILTEDDKCSWNVFKEKLIQILGHNPDHYKNQFKTFKRNSMRLGLALSTLTQYFKRGWGISGRELSPIEEDMIKDRFISSLDMPLRVMLKAEANKLTLRTILSRSSELEICFASDKSHSLVNSIESPQNCNEILDALKTSHMQMMEMMKSYKEDKSKRKRPNPEVFKKLNGLCSFYVKGNDCPKSSCRYRHSGEITEEQKEIVKNLK